MNRKKATIDSINPDGTTGKVTFLNGPNAGQQLDFNQPLVQQSGVKQGDTVRAAVIDVVSPPVVVSIVKPLRGTIKTINPDGATGTLESKFGETINFDQPFVGQLGIAVDDEVRYRLVDDGAGNVKAIALIEVNDIV